LTRTVRDDDPFPLELADGRYRRDPGWQAPPHAVGTVARYVIAGRESDPERYAAVKYVRPHRAGYVPRGQAERDARRRLEEIDHPGIVKRLDEVSGGNGALYLISKWMPDGALVEHQLPMPQEWIDRVVPRWLENLLYLIDKAKFVTNDLAIENLYPTGSDLLFGDFDQAVPADLAEPPMTRLYYAPPVKASASAKEVYGAGMVLFEIASGHRLVDLLGGRADESKLYDNYTPTRASRAVHGHLDDVRDPRHRAAIETLLNAPALGAEMAIVRAIAAMRVSPSERRSMLVPVAAAAFAALAVVAVLLLSRDGRDAAGEGQGPKIAQKTTTTPKPNPEQSVAASSSTVPSTAGPATTETTTPPPTPSVKSFSIGAKEANVHEPVSFSYEVVDVPEGGRAVLQKQVGTADSWATVKDLAPDGNSNTLASSHSGEATYQIAVVDSSGGGLVASSEPQTIRIYGPVPISDFIDNPQSETVRIGSSIFRYVVREVSDHSFEISGKHCRYIDIDVGFLAGDVPGTEAAKVTVLSEKASSLRRTIQNKTVDHIAGRVGGDIQIYAPNLEIGGFSDDSIFVNGKLYCS
jgi:hypothetical protein